MGCKVIMALGLRFIVSGSRVWYSHFNKLLILMLLAIRDSICWSEGKKHETCNKVLTPECASTMNRENGEAT